MLFLKYFLCLSLFYVLTTIQCEAVELRAIIDNSTNIRENLIRLQAIYQGDYAFHDYIYINYDTNKSLNQEFLRIREYQITRWQQMPIVVVHKVRNPDGEAHKILFYEEFDTLIPAKQSIPSYFSKKCCFFRHGWEYQLGNMHIFVEEINNLPPSIEIIASSQEEIFRLFDAIGIIEILSDSVPEWYCKSHLADSILG